MVFVDGTNLFHRLQAAHLRVKNLTKIFTAHLQGRQLTRIYLYTVQQHLDAAKAIHGDDFLKDIRVVLGTEFQPGTETSRKKESTHF